MAGKFAGKNVRSGVNGLKSIYLRTKGSCRAKNQSLEKEVFL